MTDMMTLDWSRELTTRTGFEFNVRPAQPSDEAALAAFFTHVTPDDLRFRFLTGLKTVGHDRLAAMTMVDHRQTENFLAFIDDEAEIIAPFRRRDNQHFPLVRLAEHHPPVLDLRMRGSGMVSDRGSPPTLCLTLAHPVRIMEF